MHSYQQIIEPSLFAKLWIRQPCQNYCNYKVWACKVIYNMWLFEQNYSLKLLVNLLPIGQNISKIEETC